MTMVETTYGAGEHEVVRGAAQLPRVRQRRAARAAAAISALATRVSFLVVPWLVLTGGAELAAAGRWAGLGWAVLAVAGQTLAYVAGCPLGARLADRGAARVSLVAELASAVALAGFAFAYAGPAPLLALVALVGLARAVADRAHDALVDQAPEAGPVNTAPTAPPREGLITAATLLAGAGIGAVGALLGPLGGLWLTVVAFGVSAALTVLADPVPPSTPAMRTDPTDPTILHGVEWSESATVELRLVPTRSPARRALRDLRRSGLVQGLAATLFVAGLFAQAGAVVLVAAWGRDLLTDAVVGFASGAFVVGAVGAAAVLTAYAYQPTRCAALAAGYLLGGGTLLVLTGQAPTQSLPVAAVTVVGALIAGIALASVTPATGTIVAGRTTATLRSRVGGLVAIVAYLGIPLGTAAGGWIGLRASPLWAGVAAAALLSAATLTPVIAHRAWREIAPDTPPPGLRGAAQKLAGRISVTLAYADGQWLVEVRKGRALLGSRHPVKSTEALRLLASLDVPAVTRSIERALADDQDEATRQAQRMRTRLADVEAKLAGIQEMVDLSEDATPSTGAAGPAPERPVA